MKKWCDALESMLGVMCALTVGAFSVLILVDVACRFIFHFPITWLNELSILLFQVTSFIGATIALRKGMHFGLGLLIRDVWPGLSRIFQPLATALVGVASGLIVYLATIMARQAWNSTYTTLPFSQATIYVVSIFSAAIMVLFTLEELWLRWSDRGEESA